MSVDGHCLEAGDLLVELEAGEVFLLLQAGATLQHLPQVEHVAHEPLRTRPMPARLASSRSFAAISSAIFRSASRHSSSATTARRQES